MAKIIKYTKEQEKLILDNAYKRTNKLSYQELADMLGRTAEGIRKKELDLKRKNLHNKRTALTNWTKEQEDIIREAVISNSISIAGLSKKVKKDVPTVENKVLDVSIEVRKNNKTFAYWTKEEEEYLKKWYGIERPIMIGIYLGRSLESLHQKAKKMKLGGKKIFYTARECSMLLGISDSRFINYIYKGYVKSRKAVTEQLIHQIKLDDLIEFMKNHQDKWDSRNLSYEPFVTTPDWYIEKCKRDKENPIGYLDIQKKWTNEEVDILYKMKQEGKSNEEISKVLGRNVNSIQSRWNKRFVREAYKQKQKEKETLNRLIKEMKNEKAYLDKKVHEINIRKLNEDNIELISNLRMVGYSGAEISALIGANSKYANTILNKYKDEEYVVCINSKKNFDKNEELFKMANEEYSLYELCVEFNINYPDIISIYENYLKGKYELREKSKNGFEEWSKKDEELLVKLREEGLTYKQISLRLKGRTACSVRNRYSVIQSRQTI